MQDVEREARRIINSLPQRDVLTNERIDRFIDHILKFDPERMLWHCDRLFGWGGSEIGHLIAAQRGEFSFSSRRDVIREKLLYKMPDPPNNDTIRGTTMEPIIRQMFRSRHQAEEDSFALQAIRSARCPKDLPWLVGNPDDCLIINSRRVIPDYKAPRAGKAKNIKADNAPLTMAAQLTHYSLLAEFAGVQVDDQVLVVHDSDRFSELQTLSIPFMQSLKDEIVRVGTRDWNMVLNGIVPEYEQRFASRVDGADAPVDVRRAAAQAVSAQLVAEAAAKSYHEWKSRLQDLLGEYDIKDTVIDLGYLSVYGSTQTDINRGRLESYLRKEGVDLSLVQSTGQKSDEHLLELVRKLPSYRAGDDEAFIERDQVPRVSLSRKQKVIDQYLTPVREQASEIAYSAAEALNINERNLCAPNELTPLPAFSRVPSRGPGHQSQPAEVGKRDNVTEQRVARPPGIL